MKKIAIIYFDLGIGGVQRKIVDLINYLPVFSDETIEVDLLLETKPKLNFLDKIDNKNASITHKENWFSNSFFKNGKRIPFFFFIAYFLLTKKYHSILVFLPRLSIFVLILSNLFFWKKTKIILSEDIVTIDSFYRNEFTNLENIILPFLYRKADVIVCPSLFVKQQLAHEYSIRENTMVIPNWTNFHFTRKKNNKHTDIIFLGRLTDSKGSHSIHKLFPLSYKKKIRICIVGSGNNVKNQFRHITQSSNVSIEVHSQTIDVVQYLGAAKVLVSLSTSEGLPLSFLEAISQKCLVLCLRYDGVEEVIVDGKTGIICTTIDELKQRLSEILDDYSKYEPILENAQSMLKSRFSPSNMDRYWELLLNEK